MIRPARIIWRDAAADPAERTARRRFGNWLDSRGALVSVAGLVWTVRWGR